MSTDWILPGKAITMELSSYCDANCICCPWGEFPLKNRNMEFALFKKCIDEAATHGANVLDACLLGNSLLDSGLEEKLSYCREHYPSLKLYFSSTCGTHANPQFISKYIDTLHISMYGMTKDVYESVHRGAIKFEKALSNIENILALPEGKRPYIVMTFLELPENQHQMEEWKLKWEPLADEVIIWKPHNWAGRNKKIKISEEKYCEAKSCGRPFHGPLCVWVNGDVTVCCFSEDKRMIIGNLYKQTLEEISAGMARECIQKIHKSNNFYNCELPCEQCDQIFDRSDALVYTNKNRKTGNMIFHKDDVYSLQGNIL